MDSPELFNRIAEAFCSKVVMKFVILLWGEKSSLSSHGNIPVFNYKEILDLGRESRKRMLDSNDARMSSLSVRQNFPFYVKILLESPF